MDKILIGIWIINLVCSLVFTVVSAKKGQKLFLGAFFAVFPVMGFAIYFLPQSILKIQKNYAYDRESLVKRYDIEQEEAVPFIDRELNVVPIEDAMAVSSNEEKRALLLEQLKKDIHENYRVVLPAGGDSDSETAHYVAAAKMEAYRKKHMDLTKIQHKMESEPGNTEIFQEYMEKLEEYIESDLLAEKEAEIYKAEYCEKVSQAEKMAVHKITAREYGYYITYLIDLKRYEEVEKFWNRQKDSDKNEAAYVKMLQMYYDLGKKKKFYQCLEALESSKIELSPSGLKMLRYWRERGK